MQPIQQLQTSLGARALARAKPASTRAAVSFALAGFLLSSGIVRAAGIPAVLDDFSNSELSPAGARRLLIDDSGLGSKSQGTFACANGIVSVHGLLVPGRGVPAFMSFVLPVAADGHPCDLSAYSGVRLRVKVTGGILSVQAASSQVDNFDYHSSPIPAKAGDFQEIHLAFRDMRRAWSEQTPLDVGTITSINVVAFGMAKGEFSYEIDEIGFY